MVHNQYRFMVHIWYTYGFMVPPMGGSVGLQISTDGEIPIVSQDVVLCHHSCCYEQTTLVNVICCRAAISAAVNMCQMRKPNLQDMMPTSDNFKCSNMYNTLVVYINITAIPSNKKIISFPLFRESKNKEIQQKVSVGLCKKNCFNDMYPLKFMPIYLKRSNFPLFKYFTVE